METIYDAETKIWSGKKQQAFYDFDCSIGKIIFTNMTNYPKRVVQISDIDGKAVTNEEAISWAIRIAQHLKKMGLRHDDVIGIAAKNSTFVMPVAIGCWLNATPFHAINPILDEITITHLFALTKPKLIFCDGEAYEKIRVATEDQKPKIYTLVDHIEGVPRVEELLVTTESEFFYTPEPLILGGDQTVAILCSSGTTGMPKGVCLSNHQLVFEYGLLTGDDILYGSGGLDWITGVYLLVFCCTKGATRVITTKTHTAEYFVELVKKYKVTYALTPPRHVAALICCATATPENLSTIRLVTLGGGCISLASLQRLQDILQNAVISYGYQSTELGIIAGNLGLATGTSVGKLSPGIRVRIVNDDGENLGPNEVGEIYVHNGRNWNGYYGNLIETQRMRDAEGWCHTGDLGYFDAQSFLFVVDRKKEINKYQGMHYWPAEIERVIAELPAVMDVAVVGIYDEKHGDAAGAVVVKAKGSDLTAEHVEQHVAKRFTAFYKHLHAGVIFVEKLPQSVNGKTITKEAKALFKSSVENVL